MPSSAGMTLKATVLHCLVLVVLCPLSAHRASGAAASSKKTEIWQIDVLPGPPHHERPPPPAPSHKLGLDHGGLGNGGLGNGGLGNGGLDVLSGDNFGQPLLTQTAQPHFPIHSPGWQPHPDCGYLGKTDMSVLAPIITLVVGFLVIVPLVGLLALAKMQLWQQLTGGTVTPTVTTTVGGKEDVLARRLSDAWPAFKDALGKYVNQDSKKV